jgi:hypothetical protein
MVLDINPICRSHLPREVNMVGKRVWRKLISNLCVLFLGALILVTTPSQVFAQSNNGRSKAYEAIMLVRLLELIEWKETADTICVIGTDPFGSLLERVSGRAKVDVQIQRRSADADLEGCHLAWVAPEVGNFQAPSQTVTVSRNANQAAIQLTAAGGGLQVQVDASALERVGTVPSRQLTSLSRGSS